MPEDLILNVDFDLTAVEKGIDKLQKKFNSQTAEYDKILKRVAELDDAIELINESERVGLKVTQQEKTYRDALVNQSATLSDRAQELLERTQRLGAELESARLDPRSFAEANGYLKQTENSAGKAAGNVEKVGKNSHKAASGMKSVGSNAKKVESGTNAAAKAMQNFGKRISNTIKSALIFSVIYKALNALKSIMSSVIKANDGASSSLAKLKGNLAVAFQPILDKCLPIIQKLIDKLVLASEYFALIVHRLTGADIQESIKKAQDMQKRISEGADGATSSYDKQIKTIDRQVKALEKQIKAIDKATDALKKQYETEKKIIDKKKAELNEQIDAIESYIDQIEKQEKAEQKLVDAQKQAIQNQIDALNDQKAALAEAQNERKNQYDAEKKAVDAQISDIDKQIKSIQELKDAREDEMKANEKSLASFDTLNILQGQEEEDPELAQYEAQIAALEDKKDALNEQKDAIQENEDKTTEAYEAQTDAIESQITALEKRKDAIQDVDYSAVIDQQKTLIDGIQTHIAELDKLAAKLQEDYELKVSVNDEAKANIQEQIDKLDDTKTALEDAKGAADKLSTSLDEGFTVKIDVSQIDGLIDKILIAGGAVGLIIGLIGLFTGNIPMMVVGFGVAIAAFGALIKRNWEEIKDWIKKNWEEFVEWFKGLPHDIHGMLLGVVEVFQGVFDLLKGIFTLNFKLILRGILEIIIGALNAVMGAIFTIRNAITETLNNLIREFFSWFDNLIAILPDSLEERFSKKVSAGFIEPWDFHPIPVPALAKGAVLPGGKPFLAMLGDQPTGQTNIEAPLDTLVQAFKAAVSETGGGETNVTINFSGSLSQLVRVLVPEIEIEKKRRSVFN